MNQRQAARAADLLNDLAELLSTNDCEITASELLENISGRTISDRDSEFIKESLYA